MFITHAYGIRRHSHWYYAYCAMCIRWSTVLCNT